MGSLAGVAFGVRDSVIALCASPLRSRPWQNASTIPAWNASNARYRSKRAQVSGVQTGLAVGVGYRPQFGADRFGKEFASFVLLGKWLSSHSGDVDVSIPHWAFICDVDDANDHCLPKQAMFAALTQSKDET